MPMQLFCLHGQELPYAITDTQAFFEIVKSLPVSPVSTFKALTAHGSPLVLAEFLALSAALLCWLLYLSTKNCSHVDRLWSILPPFYLALFARDDLAAVTTAAKEALHLYGSGAGAGAAASALVSAGRSADQRLLAAFFLVTVWGIRLTYNFWRKGGYSMRLEDYRWLEVRKVMPKPVFEVFNLVFVAFAQHVLLLLTALPAYVAYRHRVAEGPQPLGLAGWTAVAVFAMFFAGEVVADEQQWAFQTEKHARLREGRPLYGDFKRGFRTTGLFQYSRHPNFFCEYGLWWALYVLCAALPYRCALGWAAAGAFGLTLLFHAGSLWITERISSGRYPEYTAYQRTTSAIVPWWPKRQARREHAD